MKLNKNSWYNKLYTYMWDEYNPQKSLCPYFWKLIICLLSIIPVSILAFLPFVTGKIANLFLKEKDEWTKDLIKYDAIVMNLFFNVALGLIFCMIFVFIPIDLGKDLYQIGIFMWCAVIASLSYYFSSILYKKNKNKNKPLKEPTSSFLNVTSEFIKAKYNKYCPSIEWVGDDELPKTTPINPLDTSSIYDNN